MSQVVVAVIIKAQPGRVEEVVTGFAPIIEQTHGEEGCLNYALHRDLNDPDKLVLIERWRSQADLDEHFTKPYMAQMGEMAAGLLAEPPTISFCTPEPLGDPAKGTLG